MAASQDPWKPTPQQLASLRLSDFDERIPIMSKPLDAEFETHPIQLPYRYGQQGGRLPKAVTMAAYEVYCHCHGEQEALVTGNCRGGFHVSEIIAFLYARSFPKSEWEARVLEAERGMNLDG